MTALDTTPVARPHELPLTRGMAVLRADVSDRGVQVCAPDGSAPSDPAAGALVLVRRDGAPVAVLTTAPGEDVAALAATAAGGPTSVREITPQLPTVSVLIPTAGRPEDLRRCLRSLAGQRHRPLEIVVVDNDPADGRTREVVEQVAAEVDVPLLHITEPRRGSSIARNTGLLHVRGEVVALTDDDVIIDPGWTAAVAAGFAADPQVGCVTGLVMPAELETEAQVLFERYGGFAKGLVAREWRSRRGPEDGVLHPYACGTFGSGNNMAFRTSVLHELGGFDIALGAGSPARAGADIEAFLRVLLAGHALRYEPAALVWHRHRRGMDELARQLDSYGSGLSAIGVKHLLHEPLALVRRVPTALRFLLSSSSTRNSGRSGGYPSELARAELRGVLAGPWRYAKARWAARDVAGLGDAQAALLGTTAINGLLGIAYWLLAARHFPAAELGVAAAWVAALVPLASVGQLNFSGALQRFLPGSGRHAASLLRRGYAAAVPSCLLLGLVFLLLGPQELTGGTLGWMLLLSLPVWAVFSLQDTALLGIGRPWVVPVENAAYGVAKLGLLVLLAPVGGAEVIALSWVAPAVLAVLVVNLRLFRQLLPEHAVRGPQAVGVPDVELRRFVGADFVASLLGSLPLWGVPMLLVGTGEPEAAAVWAAAVLLSQVVDLAALALNGPLTVHLAQSPEAAGAVLRRHIRRLAWLLVPYGMLAALGAPLLMGAFGEPYAEGALVLQLLLLVGLARAAAMTAAAVARARSELRTVLLVHALGGMLGLGLAGLLLPSYGASGAALGLLGAWTAAAAYGVPAVRATR